MIDYAPRQRRFNRAHYTRLLLARFCPAQNLHRPLLCAHRPHQRQAERAARRSRQRRSLGYGLPKQILRHTLELYALAKPWHCARH